MATTAPTDTVRERIAASALWRGLDEATLDAVAGAGETIELVPRQALFKAGDAYRGAIYVHLEGTLEQVSGRGDERTAEPGDILGLANYLDQADYRSTARAHDHCRVLALPDATVKRLEHESPAFHEVLNRALAIRMRKMRQVRETVRGVMAQPARSIMRSGLMTCSAATTIAEAATTLDQHRIGSLGVVDDDGRLVGLLTPLDLLRALTHGDAARDDSVFASACQDPVRVTPTTPLWQVEDQQQRNRTKYALVVDDADQPIGMISQTDLVRALATPAQTFDADVAGAASVDDLARLREQLPAAARRAHETHRSAGAAVQILTEAHLALQHRLIEITLADMAAAGDGKPPTAFAWLIMGSGGRGEMLLYPDQDNALILPDDASRADRDWFQRLAERVNQDLDRIGYPLCPGDIMASRPGFLRTLGEWQRHVTRLARNPASDAARWSTIVFDFRTQYGDDRLTQQLRDHVTRELRQAKGMLKYMAHDDAEGRPPLGLFNRLLTQQHGGEETIDIKRNGLRIIADAARIYALAHGVAHVGTHERLQALGRIKVFDDDFVESQRLAFEELQDLLLGHQIAQAEAGRTPDPYLRIARLTSHDRERLRVALRAARRLQDRLQHEFGVAGAI